MNFISILGILVLLGIAWLLSYHKSEIKIRPIIWGICLQLLFALIILRDDQGSFFGMIILGSLLITYMFRKDNDIQQSISHFFVILFINSIIILLINNSKLLLIVNIENIIQDDGHNIYRNYEVVYIFKDCKKLLS